MRHDVNNSPPVVVDARLAAYVHHCVCFEVPFGMGQNKLYQIGQWLWEIGWKHHTVFFPIKQKIKLLQFLKNTQLLLLTSLQIDLHVCSYLEKHQTKISDMKFFSYLTLHKIFKCLNMGSLLYSIFGIFGRVHESLSTAVNSPFREQKTFLQVNQWKCTGYKNSKSLLIRIVFWAIRQIISLISAS